MNVSRFDGGLPALAGLCLKTKELVQGSTLYLPMQVDGKGGLDLVVGSKNRDAQIGWLESPTEPRDLAAWRWHCWWRTTVRACPNRSAIAFSFRWYPAARAAAAWGSRSRRPSSRSTTARSNAKAFRDTRSSRYCCRWSSAAVARRLREMQCLLMNMR